jgi:hypothetical protein
MARVQASTEMESHEFRWWKSMVIEIPSDVGIQGGVSIVYRGLRLLAKANIINLRVISCKDHGGRKIAFIRELVDGCRRGVLEQAHDVITLSHVRLATQTISRNNTNNY